MIIMKRSIFRMGTVIMDDLDNEDLTMMKRSIAMKGKVIGRSSKYYLATMKKTIARKDTVIGLS